MAINKGSLHAAPRKVALSGEVISVILLLPIVLRVAQGWVCRVSSRYLWDYGPGQFAWAAHQVAAGESLYRDFRHAPHLPIPYNPIAFYIAAVLSKAFGSDVMSALEAGRVETIAATAAITVFIFLFARRIGARRESALFAVVAFLVARLLDPSAFAFRCDMPALAFDIAGVYLFSAGFEVWSVAIFVLAFFTRQSEIAGVAAVCLFSWSEGRGRAAAAIAISFTAAIAAGILLLHLLLPNYAINTILALSPIYDFRAPIRFFERTLRGDVAIPILAGSCLVVRRARTGLAGFFLLTTLIQAAATSLRWGSDVSYFIAPLAAASVLAAAGVDDLFDWVRRTSRAMEVWAAVVLAFAVALSIRTGSLELDTLARGDLSCDYLHTDLKWDPNAEALLRNTRGAVLTDWPDLLLRPHPFSADFIELGILNGMRSAGRFDDAPLLDAIRRREYSAIVLDSDLLDGEYRGRAMMWPELKQAIAENYRLVSSPGPPRIMLPAPGDAAPGANH